MRGVGTAASFHATEEPAFADFFEATHANVFRAVLVIARDWHVAEDATASAYLRAWERWTDVSHHPAPIAWVIRVALTCPITRLALTRPLTLIRTNSAS
jgi:DNA-directed RNA polymerase specialized sigma24 family protein